MKKITLMFVLVVVFVTTFVNVSGAWAADRPPAIPLLGPGQYQLNTASFPTMPGMTNFAVVWVTIPGEVCFVNTYASVADHGHVKGAAIRKLDNGKWVQNALPSSRTEVSSALGYLRCAEVGVGIWAFQGW